MTETDQSNRCGDRPDANVFDVVAFGFGPSNLALAIAAAEAAPARSVLFLEEKPEFRWHPGMMLAGSKMQISFLKDLVTLRDPTSPFTFLQYLKAKGRLERFVNLREFHPTRIEYNDYLAWVASHFRDQVRYGSRVESVRPMAEAGSAPALFELAVSDVATGTVSVVRARNVVYACGGEAHFPIDRSALSSRIVHSDEFLARFPQRFTAHSSPYVFAVSGDGQSAAELVAHLLESYPASKVHLLLSGYAPRPADSSPFVNEAFFSRETDAVYEAGDSKRRAVLAALRNTNYGVVDLELIEQIYRSVYLDEVRGDHRLVLHPFVKLTSARDVGDCVELMGSDQIGSDAFTLQCDGLVMATGYRRNIDPRIFAEVLPLLSRDASDRIALSRSYRAETTSPMDCGLYLQGYCETSHGIGDSLLSLIPFRSKEILDDVCRTTPAPARAAAQKRRIAGEYPPQRHLERDLEKLYAVIERFRFATLISVGDDREPFITHIPLTLDRSRTAYGVLFGHMDRANPHADWLDDREIRVIFHGPNAYISPHELETDQLPTWNSIAVHVRGKVRVLDDNATVVRGIAGISEHADRAAGAYRLDLQDPRIAQLIDYIVGFEIEIEELVGRFKLSQDRTRSDRELAGRAFMRDLSARDGDLVADIVGIDRPANGSAVRSRSSPRRFT